MLESKSAASVSPSLSFNLENDVTFTFNFQPDGQLAVIAVQNESAVAGAFSPEQTTQLRDALSAFLEKRG